MCKLYTPPSTPPVHATFLLSWTKCIPMATEVGFVLDLGRARWLLVR